MSTSTAANSLLQSDVSARVLSEGYGPGAWHGPDLKAALADVTPVLAFWRPATGRHNIAEIALHHAYTVRAVRQKLSGRDAEPFVLDGEDWFELNDDGRLSWADVRAVVEREQQRLAELLTEIERSKVTSPAPADERFGLLLGITCHAVYHAGQVQLIRRLGGE